jgi:hypothetical protein
MSAMMHLILELQAYRPEDVLADEIAVPGGGIIEDGGVHLLAEVHHANSPTASSFDRARGCFMNMAASRRF